MVKRSVRHICKPLHGITSAKHIYFSTENPKITIPSTTSTIPVARFNVFGSALLANKAAMRAQINVNITHSPKTVQSGVPPIVKWDKAPVSAVKVIMKTLVPTAVFNS